MARVERFREALGGPVAAGHLEEKEKQGWKLIALEWEREARSQERPGAPVMQEVPYGMMVSDDCHYLTDNPAEQEVLLVALELIVQDRPLSRVADELNQRGLRTRQGTKWNAALVFNILPRLVDAGPRLLSSEEWAARRPRLLNLV